jgi:hypothetical protein
MQMEAIQANKNALTSCMKSGILTNIKHVKKKNTPTEKEKKIKEKKNFPALSSTHMLHAYII